MGFPRNRTTLEPKRAPGFHHLWSQDSLGRGGSCLVRGSPREGLFRALHLGSSARLDKVSAMTVAPKHTLKKGEDFARR